MIKDDGDQFDIKKIMTTVALLHNKIFEIESQKSEPIAIIGASCRLPGGANSLDDYWDLLINGKDAISEVPSDRWSLDEYYDQDPDAPNKMYCKWGGFLTNTNVQDFDAKFFDIVPLEAQMMDPQQRLALEVTWEAIEHAGIAADNLNGAVAGVFFGVTTNDYANLIRDSGDITAYTNSGSSHSVLAGRISYELGLQGPSMVLDTACSSSLVAIHQACKSLRDGESSLAIAGGVNLMLTPDATIGFCKGRFLAEDGRCKTFDDTANGYVRGEGCGVIILKRLSDAKRDGDNILAVIKGSAVNQDGASGGLTVPNGPAQEAVIRQALVDANVKPGEINYVEAHGTGTSLGDPIEVNALEHVLKEGRDKSRELIIASVKTNIGHLEAAAGMASIIKVILAMQYEEIPKHLHFNKLNHNISLDEDIKIIIPTENTKWQRGERRRIAGISGFAFQGTNAHVIIEEAPLITESVNQDASQVNRPSHVLAISAKSIEALQDLSSSYIELLNQNNAQQDYLANLSFSANNFRSSFNQRLAVVGKDSIDVKTKLQAWLDNGEALRVLSGEVISQAVRKNAFLFTGQGSQYAGMGKELYDTNPTFKKYLDTCAEILQTNNYLDKSLLSILWGDDSKLIDETKYTQPALFALEYALYQLWLSWGVTPSAVIGHSVGEYVAACVAGIFSLEDGLKLISKRAALMQSLPQNGAMAAIAVSEQVLLDAIKHCQTEVAIAAINSVESVVISGNVDAVKKLTTEFAAKNIKTKELQVSHAFHSHLLEPMLSDFEAVLREIKFVKPTVTLISNLSGAAITGDEIITPEYWIKHTRYAVRFNDGVNALISSGITNFIEIGPNPVLLAMAQECVFDADEDKYHFLPSMRRDVSPWDEILTSLGKLYVSGTAINWKDFDKDYNRHKVQLPTYPFQRQRYWVDVKSGHNQVVSNVNHPILTHQVISARDGSVTFEAELSPKHTVMLEEHRVYEVPVLPAVAYLELAIASVSRLLDNAAVLELEDIGFEKALAVLDDTSVEVQVNLLGNGKGYDFSIYSRRLPIIDTQEWSLNVSGTIRAVEELSKPSAQDIASIQQRASDSYTGTSFLAKVHEAGMTFGPRFSSLQHVWAGDGEALGEIVLPSEYISEINDYEVYPAIFDTGLQLLIANLPFASSKSIVHLPVGISKLTRYGKPTTKSWVYVTWQPVSGNNPVEQKSLRGDIKLLDEFGNIIVDVIGLTAIDAPRDAILQDVQQKSIAPYYEIIWEEQSNVTMQHEIQEQLWVVFADSTGVAKSISTLGAENKSIEVISVGANGKYKLDISNKESYKNIFTEILSANNFSKQVKIINLLPLDVKESGIVEPDIIQNQILCYASTLYIAQIILEVSKNLNLVISPELIVITHGVQEAKTIWQAQAWGLGKVLALEAPQLLCKMIDIDIAENSTHLFNEILLPQDFETQVALKQDKRFVARLKALQIDTSISENIVFNKDAIYWITGGLGGIGSVVTSWMLEHGARNIILTARSSPTYEAENIIRNLNTQYKANVFSIQLDIADSVAVKKALIDYKPKGIIHAAGVLEDDLLAQQTWESFEHVMRPKVLGAWNLHNLSTNLTLDFLVFFSSQTAMLGNVGQANYAAANAFLDALAQYRKSKGLQALSIDWGPWSEVGMATRDNYQQELSIQGISGIKNTEGLLYLESLMLDSQHSQIGAFNINWHIYLDNFYTKNNPAFFNDVITRKSSVTNASQKRGPKSQILEQLQKADVEQKSKLLQIFLSDELTKLLGPRLKGIITVNTGFMDLGVDSLLAVEFRKILKTSFEGYAKISPTAAFDYPNIETMGEYILSQISFDDSDTKELSLNKPTLKAKFSGSSSEPIAIIGMSCRMPGGANSLDEYWQLLENGVDAISEVPSDRWSLAEYYDPDPDAPGKMYSKWGGFLKNVDVAEFDAPFFNITPAEATDMDPQQRMLLEVVWEALEIGGINPRSLNKSATAMFVAQGTIDYSFILYRDLSIVSPYSNSGLAGSVTAGRVSYILGLQGPCMTIDTACSASLIAIHEACNALRYGEADMAIASGVNLDLSPELTVGFCKARMLSPDGKCKTFDASANGYARGEGCGAIILKRLSDARRDGDRILAVIRGSATNQDGSSGGLTVPNGPAQQAVIRTALQQAGIKPSAVSYVETHGTGTSLGDPIEVQALGMVYGEDRDNANPITIGSVKTNFGHLETAAGMASIIKVVLALQHKKIPKHLNFKTINPMISLEDIPATIPTETRDWVVSSGTRIAGLSGFAFQGSNAHVIVEEATEFTKVRSQIDRAQFILCLSGKNDAALKDLVVSYTEQVFNRLDLDLGDVCYTANTGRALFEMRLAVVGASSIEMAERLSAWLESGESVGVINGNIENKEQKNAFLFTGQGSQYAGMGKELYDTSPTFKKSLDKCAEILKNNNYLDKPLLSILWDDESNLIDETKYTQPALFAFEYALHQLWVSWGVTPSAVIGHSVGEYVAACVAGVFSLEDGLKLICMRAALMQELPQNGAMAAIAVSEQVMFEAIKPYDTEISIAAINGPESVVISGSTNAVKKLTLDFAAKGIKTHELQVSHAFHSHLLEPMLSDFEAVLREINFAKPNITLISNLNGVAVTNNEIVTPEYWLKHTRNAVRFSDSIKALIHDFNITNFIEIGPNPVLLAMAQECTPDSDSKLFLPSLRRDKDNWVQILESLGSLYVNGATINWKDFDKDYSRHKVQLPTYPFQRQRYWVDVDQDRLSYSRDRKTPGVRTIEDLYYEPIWQAKELATAVAGEAGTQAYVIVADDLGLADALAASLEVQGAKVFNIYFTNDVAAYKKSLQATIAELPASNFDIIKVIHMCGINADNSCLVKDDLAIIASQKFTYNSALLLTQELISAKLNNARLYFITANAQSVNPADNAEISILQSPLWGFGRSVALEQASLGCTNIDVGNLTDQEQQTKVVSQLVNELNTIELEDEVAFRDKLRYVRRLTHATIKPPELSAVNTSITADGYYLITGGLGGIGITVATWLVAKGAKHLVLCGRSKPTVAVMETIQTWQTQGVEVKVASLDVAKSVDVKNLFNELIATQIPIKGILHAAGTFEAAPLLEQDFAKYEAIIATKILGSLHLQNVIEQLDIKPDFFVNFSSISSILGLTGQSNYAAANAFLDGFTVYQRNKGINAYCINWGMWADVGFVVKESGLADKQQMATSMGMQAIRPAMGIQALEQILTSYYKAQIIVADNNWNQYLDNFASKYNLEFFSIVAKHYKRALKQRAKDAKNPLIDKLLETNPENRKPIMQEFLQQELKKLLGLETSVVIDVNTGLMTIGLDSLLAVEFRNRLKRDFSGLLDNALNASFTFNYPTIEAMSNALLDELFVGFKPSGNKGLAVTSLNINQHEPIAIIGMSCRFPGGANSVEEFWQMLADGVDGIVNMPKERFDVDSHYDVDPDAPQKMYTRSGGFLSEVDKFDAGLFRISPREALALDPQQRLLLETSWGALENAGIDPLKLDGSKAGVYVGIAASEYQSLLLNSIEMDELESHMVTGNASNAAAGRLSYTYGLQGPAMSIDTACSSSLVAVHLACQGLREGACDSAIAAGVNVMCSTEGFVLMSRTRALAFDGHCKTFDKSADGYARAEGCGVLVLKRLSDAQRDNDNILAVIRGSAVNQDGQSTSFTAPNGLAQQALIESALVNAQVLPNEVSYIEAHGTGTPLGDPIEVASLANIYATGDRDIEHPLIIGTVKTNIGHTESAAGIAGIIKTVLAMQHKQIPKHLNFKELNPEINLNTIPAKIPTELMTWEPINGKRIAGVSSFGISGTNAHVIIEAAPEFKIANIDTSESNIERPSHILAISAQNMQALEDLSKSYVGLLEDNASNGNSAEYFANLSYSANNFRSNFNQRLAVVGVDASDAKTKLQRWLEVGEAIGVVSGEIVNQSQYKIAFLCTGGGSQYVGMGKTLYDTNKDFKESIDLCSQILSKFWEVSLQSIMWGEHSDLIDRMDYMQPALFALEYSMAQVWKSWGIEPQAVIGHSLGEYVAATLAGVFSLEDGLTLLTTRARLMHQAPGDGAMASIAASEVDVAQAIESYDNSVAIGAVNGPLSTIISGDRNKVVEILGSFESRGVKVKLLPISNASHSPLMESILDKFEEAAIQVKYAAPQIAMISNVTGNVVEAQVVCNADYWKQHIRNTVRFNDGMQALHELGCNCFIELGPQSILLGMGQSCVPQNEDGITEGEWLASLEKDKPDWDVILKSLGRLYTQGVKINWLGFDKDHVRYKVQLPTYPFQGESYWVEQGSERSMRAGNCNPLLGYQVNSPLSQDVVYEAVYNTRTMPLIADHRVYHVIIIPGALHIARILNWVVNSQGSDNCIISDLSFDQAIVLKDDQSQIVQLVLTPKSDNLYEINLYSTLEEKVSAPSRKVSWSLNASGILRINNPLFENESLSLEDVRVMCNIAMDIEAYNYNLVKNYFQYGPGFIWVDNVWVSADSKHALGEMRLPESKQEAENYILSPGLIDCCFQVLSACHDNALDPDIAFIPLSIRELVLHAIPHGKLWCHASIDPQANSASNLLSGNMELYSENGSKILTITQFTAIQAPQSKLLQFISKNEDDLLYVKNWQQWQIPQVDLGECSDQTWLIFAPLQNTKMSEQLIQNFTANNGKAILVYKGDAFCKEETNVFKIVPSLKNDMEQLFEQLKSEVVVNKIIYLWPLDASFNSAQDLNNLIVDQENIYAPVLYIAQHIAGLDKNQSMELYLITSETQMLNANVPAEQISLSQAPLWGLSRVIPFELTEVTCVTIDIQSINDESLNATQLLNYIAAQEHLEDQLVICDGIGYIPRLERLSNVKRDTHLTIPNTESYELTFNQRGTFDNLQIVPNKRLMPNPDEIEIRVHATGLNFRDVMNVLGVYPGEAGGIGGEAAGEVTFVGANVQNFKIGDKVFCVGFNCFASHVIVPKYYAAHMLPEYTYEQAATIPIIFLTAYYGLNHLAKLSSGERVLIHAGAGGVGLAAIQLAQAAGAVIYVTVGSEPKRALMLKLGIKPEHIMNSRNLDFADQIMRLTNNEGVDVVLNSLANEFIPKSMELLRDKGRFLEIGKTGIWTVERALALNPKIEYFAIDLVDMMLRQSEYVGNLLQELYLRFARGELQPLQQTIFSLENSVNAFRFMAQGKHIGKVIISQDVKIDVDDQSMTPKILSDATYLITGGLGGLGLLVAKWLVDKGAKHLVLIGRSAASDAVNISIEDLRQTGVDVVIIAADVSKAIDVATVFSKIKNTMPQLRGIIHAAGILDDALLSNQDYDKYFKVIAPKILGAWNLQQQIVNDNAQLDFFISFSAAAALLGNPGQSNYAAANAFLDVLTYYQNACDIRALSINWGPWSEVGMASILDKSQQQQLSLSGVNFIQPNEGIQVLDKLFSLIPNIKNAAVLNINWDIFLAKSKENISPLLQNIARKIKMTTKKVNYARNNALIQELVFSGSNERRDILAKYLESEIKAVLGLNPAVPFAKDSGFASMGMDSLMAVEFRNRITKALGDSFSKALPATLMFNYPNVNALTEYLLSEVLALEEKKIAKVVKSHRSNDEPIAIIGMSCRMPGGANNLDEYWKILIDGKDAITEVPISRFDVNNYYDVDQFKPGKLYCKLGGFLNYDITKFDAAFFKISDVEAQFIDPQHRLALEVCWEALENANILPSKLYGTKTSVFFGISSSEYSKFIKDDNEINAYTNPGLSQSMLAGRISYAFGLHGPSQIIDTACSSSLVAIHQACNSLKINESNLAIVGGVNLMLIPESTIGFCKAGVLSHEGKTMSFDENSDGYIRGEGCGVLILKRVSEAIRDGDEILAVIKGSAVNQNGASSNITVPNGPAQQEVILQAIANANLSPDSIDYIEAHGTATKFGDEIELNCISEVFAPNENSKHTLFVSSVKPNIGHLEAAAGASEMIKAVLCLQHEIIPQQLYFKKLNPNVIISDNLDLIIATENIEWPRSARPRIAGISGFGFQGTNAHVVIQEAPIKGLKESDAVLNKELGMQILTISAKDTVALKELVMRYKKLMTQDHSPRDTYLADLCYTANTRRTHFYNRLAFIGMSLPDMISHLDAWLSGVESGEIFDMDKPRNTDISSDPIASEVNKLAVKYISGEDVDWELFYKDKPVNLVSLPNYPFQRKRYWIGDEDF